MQTLIGTATLNREGTVNIYRHEYKDSPDRYTIRIGPFCVAYCLLYTQLKPEHQLAVARVRLNKL